MTERSSPTAVAVRQRASGRFLAVGATWTADEGEALVLDLRDAASVIARFVCEPDAVDVVALDRRCLAVA